MRRASLVLSPLVLTLLVLPACGGGDEQAKAAYVEQAEAVCARANAARQAVPAATSAAGIPKAVRALVDVAAGATAELAALKPPEKDAAQIQEKFVGPLQSQVQDGQAYAARVQAAKGSDAGALLRLLAEAPTETRADLEFLRDYGFRACVEAADTASQTG